MKHKEKVVFHTHRYVRLKADDVSNSHKIIVIIEEGYIENRAFNG